VEAQGGREEDISSDYNQSLSCEALISAPGVVAESNIKQPTS